MSSATLFGNGYTTHARDRLANQYLGLPWHDFHFSKITTTTKNTETRHISNESERENDQVITAGRKPETCISRRMNSVHIPHYHEQRPRFHDQLAPFTHPHPYFLQTVHLHFRGAPSFFLHNIFDFLQLTDATPTLPLLYKVVVPRLFVVYSPSISQDTLHTHTHTHTCILQLSKGALSYRRYQPFRGSPNIIPFKTRRPISFHIQER